MQRCWWQLVQQAAGLYKYRERLHNFASPRRHLSGVAIYLTGACLCLRVSLLIVVLWVTAQVGYLAVRLPVMVKDVHERRTSRELPYKLNPAVLLGLAALTEKGKAAALSVLAISTACTVAKLFLASLNTHIPSSSCTSS